MFEEYVLNNHKEDLIKILEDSDIDKHYSININFVKLFEKSTEIGNNLLKEPNKVLSLFDKSVIKAQQLLKEEIQVENEQYTEKSKVHARISGLPACPELHRTIFPTSHDLGSFLQVSGTVVRITTSKMLEFQRQFMCMKCKYVVTIEADYEQKFILYAPKKCSNPGSCDGKNIIPVKTIEHGNCKDYQEIKLQEQVSKLSIGSMPSSMWVTLEDDLVDCCKPGDDVTVCGIIMRRWKPPTNGKKLDVELVLRANHVQVNNDQRSIMFITPEIKSNFRLFWETYKNNPLIGRDTILKSFCPQLYGVYLVKLAVSMILAGGSRTTRSTDSGIRIRSEPHLLLVGDPGTGKSQLLRFASKIIPRSVLTTGIGTTSAGLTVSAVMEDGEWQLEAGALVLADEGICCIDEFSSMKEHDRASIHEAMEQQTISVAKGSMVCKLSTRCSILAATNPKGHIDSAQPLSINTTLASPLLSRFDLVLLLRDTQNYEWDEYVCNHILNIQINNGEKNDEAPWSIELLQAYFIVIKNLHPILTEESNVILSAYYQAQRQAPTRNVARTTVRLLDSLVRLSQAHARLMFRTEVLIMDAVMAIALIESSMQGAALLLSTDVHTLHTPFPEDPTENYIQLLTTILIKLNLNELLERELNYINNTNPDNNEENKNISKKKTVVDVTMSQIKRTVVDLSTLNNCKNDKKENKITDLNKTNKTCGKQETKTRNEYLNEDTSEVPINKTDSVNITKRKSDTKLDKTENKKSKNSRKENRKSTNKNKNNDLNLINMIPSINDVYSLNDLDEFSPLNEPLSGTIENVVQNNEILPTTQEKKYHFVEKMSDLRCKFAFKKKTPPKNDNSEVHTNINNDSTNVENDLNSFSEFNNQLVISSTQEKKDKKFASFRESFAFKPRNKTPDKVEIELNIESKKPDEEAVSNSDSQSQSSQLSAKTLFQNPDDIDDLELDL